MLAGLAFGSEIKRFGRSRMTRVAIVVLMLLPLVYGALYLWAFWDPFGHVNKMPVALVNSDRGAVVSGQHVQRRRRDRQEPDRRRQPGLARRQPRGGAQRRRARQVLLHGRAATGLQRGDRLAGDRATEKGQPDRGLQRRQQLHLDQHRSHRDRPGAQRRLVTDLRASGQSDAVRGGFVRFRASSRPPTGGRRGCADGARSAGGRSGHRAVRLGALATGARQLSDGINSATEPLLAVSKALSVIGGNTDQLQQGATALQQANDQIGGIATAQDAAANSMSSVIDQLAARQDPSGRTRCAACRISSASISSHPRSGSA